MHARAGEPCLIVLLVITHSAVPVKDRETRCWWCGLVGAPAFRPVNLQSKNCGLQPWRESVTVEVFRRGTASAVPLRAVMLAGFSR